MVTLRSRKSRKTTRKETANQSMQQEEGPSTTLAATAEPAQQDATLETFLTDESKPIPEEDSWNEQQSTGEADDDMDSIGAPNDDKEKDLTGDGGVIKRVIKRSQSAWEHPESGDEVSVHYVGRLSDDGTQFDSSRDRGEPFEFTLDSGSVIKGWDVAVKSMARGEIASFRIAPSYAYGESGAPPKIPPQATLEFEIELISWRSVRDLFGDRGCIRKTIQEGSGWEHVRDDDEAVVHYKLIRRNDEFVESASENTLVFPVRRDGEQRSESPGVAVPSCVARAVRDMKKGQVVQLTCAPPYAQEFTELSLGPEDSAVIELRLEKWYRTTSLADGQISVKILEEGEGWERPNEIDSRCRVIIDAGSEEEVVLGDGSMKCTGLELALAKLKKGAEAQVTIHTRQYADPSTPDNELPRTYHVKLCSFQNGKQTYEMSPQEKIEAAKRHKEIGNKLYKEQRYDRAEPHYDFIVNAFSYDSDLPAELKTEAADLLRAARLNLAAVYEKRRRPDKVIEQCKKVLERESTQTKALYRRACAYISRADYDEAMQDLNRILELDPQNEPAQRKLQELKRILREQDRRDKAFFSSMFRDARRQTPSAAARAPPATTSSA
jgi:FKBP-type peptidyl-prolyl cis-trans isomerase/Tfp pilus assembly protein PilF